MGWNEWKRVVESEEIGIETRRSEAEVVQRNSVERKRGEGEKEAKVRGKRKQSVRPAFRCDFRTRGTKNGGECGPWSMAVAVAVAVADVNCGWWMEGKGQPRKVPRY